METEAERISPELFNLSAEDEIRIYREVEVAQAFHYLREYVCAVCDKRIYENPPSVVL